MAIVIPCYNEFSRFPQAQFKAFLESHPEAILCLVDDASTDQTSEHFQQLVNRFGSQIHVLVNKQNLGKAESVRKGVLYCHEYALAPYIAYLDADLATSLEECYSLRTFLMDKEFVFASRILKVGSVIERRFSRFLIGRIVATVISNVLQLKVYDTQCGCKLFRSSLVPLLFGEPFHSRWLFDVELFSRILARYGPADAVSRMEEVPLRRWVDQGESKVKASYFFQLWIDLWSIRRNHRKAMQPWKKAA